jgi:hypothetical protein
VNEVSFRARPHHSVHNILGVDTGAMFNKHDVHTKKEYEDEII